ncbi:hypothetical protein V6N13_097710 [Hibiscus sabdariffa]|uniref:RCD1 WWE domain-containing protein n=2 Tax=Hibiscus sabdariffa TaxID=183260 RepID=A0ABR1ZV47_9ROSI
MKAPNATLLDSKSSVSHGTNRVEDCKCIMTYEEAEWTDFPHDLIASIRKYLNTKKSAVDVEIDGQSFVLDFLHMLRLELETGVMHPIDWIDEADSCFFPEATDRKTCLVNLIPLRQFEVDINGVEQPKLKECSGQSSSSDRRFHIVQKPGSRCSEQFENISQKNSTPHHIPNF